MPEQENLNTYLDIIGDIIEAYKKEDIDTALQLYLSIPEKDILNIPHIFSLHLNLGYLLEKNSVLNTDGLLHEIITEYLEEKKKSHLELR